MRASVSFALLITFSPSCIASNLQEQSAHLCDKKPEVCKFIGASSVLISNCEAYKAGYISKKLMNDAIRIYMQSPFSSEDLKRQVVDKAVETCKNNFNINVIE